MSVQSSESGECTQAEPVIVLNRNGQNFYPFQQILQMYFSATPASTVYRWLRDIGKSTVKTNALEHRYLKEHGKSTYRTIISEDDLRALRAHSKTRRKHRESDRTSANKSRTVYTSDSPNEVCSELSTEISCVDIVQTAKTSVNNTLILDDLCNKSRTVYTSDSPNEVRSELPTEISSVNIVQTAKTSVNNTLIRDDLCNKSQTGHTSDSPNEVCSELSTEISSSNSPNQVCNELSTEISSPTKVTVDKRTKIGCLNNKDISIDLGHEFDELTTFYTSTVNPLRNGSAFGPSTMKKLVERVSCFMNFCRIRYPERKLDFSVVDDVEIVQAYTTYQLDERKLSITTVVRTVSALISLSKYVHRAGIEQVESCVELVRLQNIQRQLSQRQRSYQLAARAGLTSKEENSVFMFQHLVQTVKSLREKVDSSKGTLEHGRFLHDFVLIALYVTSMCGRSREIFTLELFHEEQGRKFRFDWEKRRNVLVVSANEDKFTLYENDFKNLRSHGPSKFEIDNSMWLIPYLKDYVRERNKLLRGKTHSFMFTTATGLAFTSPAFTSYLGRLFEREVNIRAGTTKLRHALVTHVLSLPESESLKLRESLATLMRHSLKHQQFTYCDTSRQDQTSLSRDLLNKSFELAANSSQTNGVPDGSSMVAKKSQDSVSVKAGDMVALVDGATTCAMNASIFLARVIRISEDESEALLMEFREIPGQESFYRAVVDSSWYESTNSLIFPIDVVYDKKEKNYELRSSVAEIYDAFCLESKSE